MTYNASYTGIGEMLKSPEMQAAMLRKAVKVRDRAAEIAPVDTGAYKASLEASSGIEADGKRAYGRVTANVPYAFQVEYGTHDTPRHRTLGRALDAVKD